jgi:pimeloyl-ACP methyl ester carboxylesterase
MPMVQANGITMNYEVQGDGDPLVLIPYLAADQACYAFQVAEYAKHFRCISVDLRGAGLTDKPAGPYTTELFADDVAALMAAIGLERAHVAGLSLGAATGIWLAARYPERVRSLSLHSGWPKSDGYLHAVVESWRVIARQMDSVADMVVTGIFPWCFTPDFFSAKPDYMASLAEFVRSRPAQPLDAFLCQSEAVQRHDAEAHLSKITCPTLLTFGRYDLVCSTRFADPLSAGIRGAEVIVFEDCAHAPLYQDVDGFNQRTLAFLTRV